MTAPRTYAVGDRVTIVGLPKLRPDTGTVVKVRQDPLPYLVDLGPPWTPAWWSGLELEPAPAPDPAPDPWAEVAIAAATARVDAAVAHCSACGGPCRREDHDRGVEVAVRAELAKAWAEEQARPVVVKVPSEAVDLFGPGWRERDPMRKAGP